MIKIKKTFILVMFIIILLITPITLLSISLYTANYPTFEIKDTLPEGNGKKAKIILLAGQSNAAGCSRDDYLRKNVSLEKYQEYENGYNNIYINYFVSGKVESKSFVKVKTNQGEPGGFFGPELGMAEKLNELYPNQLFFIIKYTWSATDLNKLWLSPSSKGETGQLYYPFVLYVNESIKYLKMKKYDVEIEGMCWMQGESDSFSPVHATEYKQNLYNFIKDIRNEFSKYSSKDGLVFVDAYIADNPMYWVYCDMVNNSKKEVAKMSLINVIVDTIANELTCYKEPENQPDMAHYDSLSEIKLGHLFIEELSKFIQ